MWIATFETRQFQKTSSKTIDKFVFRHLVYSNFGYESFDYCRKAIISIQN